MELVILHGDIEWEEINKIKLKREMLSPFFFLNLSLNYPLLMFVKV